MSQIRSLSQSETKKTPSWLRFIYDSILAIGSISSFTGLIFWLHLYPNVPDFFLAYLLVILALASMRGIYAALLASFLAFFLFDFLFIAPLYTLIVAKFADILALLVFLITAILTSQLANALRQRAEDADRREREIHILYDVSRAINREESLQHQLSILAHSIVKVFLPWGVYNCLFLQPDKEKLVVLGGTEEAIDSMQPTTEIEQVAAWVLEHGHTQDITPEPIANHKPVPSPSRKRFPKTLLRKHKTTPYYYQRLVPLKAEQKTVGVLLLYIEAGPHHTPFENGLGKEKEASTSQGTFFSAFLEHAVVLIEQDRLRRESLKIEMLQQTDALRAALLSSVSHDLRTPLSTIKTSVTSLSEKEVQWDDEARQGFTSAIERECDRLNSLVENLLDMSRIEAGALQLEKVWYPLDELIHDVLDRMFTRFQRRAVQVVIPDDLPPIEIDHVLIDQVLTNLLENAINYTPVESPIDIDVHMEEEHVKISIADRGPGISPDEREHIFNKFYRVLAGGPASQPSSSRGSGLGLAICRAFVEAHGGTIWVDARDGGGAVFHLTLPLTTEREYSFD